MFCRISLLFVLLLQWFPLHAASCPHSEIKDDDLLVDVDYRCRRSVLELPPQAIGGLFKITVSPPYDPSEIDDVKKELYDLWVREETQSKIINFEISTSKHCTVKVLGCTRDFRETNCPVGSIWSFWSDIEHNVLGSTTDKISIELSKWCDDFVSDELANQEILLTAYGNGVWPAMAVYQWFLSKSKGKNLKVVFFNPPVDLIKSLEPTPRDKVLLISPSLTKNDHGTVIVGSLKNKKHVAHLYEVEKSRVMSSLDLPPIDDFNIMKEVCVTAVVSVSALLLVRTIFVSLSNSYLRFH